MFLKPDFNLLSVKDIDPNLLYQQGVRAILFDLDSTVMASKSGFFEPWVLDMFDKLSENFTVAILSNNKKVEYIEKAKAQCNIDVIGHANKPSPKILLNYLTSKNIEPQNALMVGDRPLTDILAGKLAGTKTILVDSITRETEPKLTRFVRFLERLTIRK